MSEEVKAQDQAEEMQTEASVQENQNAELQDSENELEILKAELAEQKDKFLRLYADFENSRRQHARRQLEMIQTANKDLIADLLPVVDDFDRALKASTANDEILQGFQLIHQKLTKTLENKGLKRMESAVGKTFDVDTMEAITKIPAPEGVNSGQVVDEVAPGFQLGELIIRYAKVVIAE
jgi:molecular chaperone GrpE